VLLVFVLGIGAMLALLYFSATYSIEMPVSRLSQEDAIRIAEADLKGRLSDYGGITGIVVNNTVGYVPFDEFVSKNLELPLVHVHPDGSLVRMNAGGDRDMGRCDNGLYAYCGYLEPYNFDYKGRLVYGVEVKIDGGMTLYMYIIDAASGKIVDSTFIRSE
jgi:predicted small secreted protein